jgi:hypothetical protein
LGCPEELGGCLEDGGEVVDCVAELLLDVADAGWLLVTGWKGDAGACEDWEWYK